MAEFSRPQPGLFPADGDDCGAYTANEWAAVLIAQNRSGGMMVTGAAAPGLPATQLFPNVGVYYSVADRLAVSSPGASQITIGTGASIVDGRVHTNDTEHTAVAITNPAANPRIDRVVVRQNYGLADYTSVNAPALVVDFNTARVCIISGAEAPGPVAPTPTQDEDRLTYWDIPLAQYQIAVGGAITNLVDEREYVDAEIKRAWIPVGAGYHDLGGGAAAPISTTGEWQNVAGHEWVAAVVLQDNVDSQATGTWRIPADFVVGSDALFNVTPVYTYANGGNMWCTGEFSINVCGQFINAIGAPGTGYGIFAAQVITPKAVAGQLIWQCATSATAAITLGTGVGIGNLLNVYFRRFGAHGNDTCATDCWFLGWEVEYLGWGRR